jgi:transaldolase
MKFFIDTANLSEIKEAYDLGVLDGVTTNPSLMAKEGIQGAENIRAHYKAICKIVDANVSAEVIATDFDGIIKEGRELAKIDDKIVVKVPMIKDGCKGNKEIFQATVSGRTARWYFQLVKQYLQLSRCGLRFTFYRPS